MRKSKFLVFLLVFFVCEILAAQKTPYNIRHYSPKEYNGFSQMWHAAQDKNGLMYFAGSTSIFIYDGTRFEPIHVKTGSAIRQIFIDSTDGTVYVGSVGEFGYLERDKKTGKQYFVSLITTLNPEQREFLDVWTIAKKENKIYFQASERIFVCANKKIVNVIEVPDDNSLALMFEASGRLYVRQRNVGLMEIRNDRLVLTPGGERFAITRIPGIMRWDNNHNIIVTADSGFFMMNTAGVVKDQYSKDVTDDFLTYAGPLGCVWVNDSVFVVNSRSGIAFYNHRKELIEVIDKTNGLPNHAIPSVFIDKQKNIWLMHNYGMSMICYNTPVLYFGGDRGYSGLVECITRYQDLIFIASVDGLFRQHNESTDARPRFERDQRIPKTEVWDLNVSGNNLFIASSAGLFYLQGENITQLNRNYTNRTFQSKAKNEIIAMEKAGLSVYYSDGVNAPELVQHYATPGIDFINGGYSDTAANGNRSMWFSDRFLRAIHLEFNIHDTGYKLTLYDTTSGLPQEAMYPIHYDEDVCFVTVDSVYRYDASLDKPGSACFVPAPDISAKLFSGNLSALRDRFDQRTFIRSDDHKICTVIGNDPGGGYVHYSFVAAPFLGDNALRNAYAEPNGILWLVTEEWLARMNTNQHNSSAVSYNTVVRYVNIGVDSLLYTGDELHVTREEDLPYSYNSITFGFSALFYEFENNTRCYYMLEGYDTTWYDSKNLREKSYTNLPEGNYTFHVKSLNAYGTPGNESTYSFTILPPWYRTTFAYGLYGAGFIASIFVSVRLGARRLRKQKERLEVIVRERTAEVVEQKQQIEKQKVDLEVAYTGIQDSIHYSQRIQHAILPTDEDIRKIVPDSFVLFIPRDIVSGDFYWFAEKNGLKFIACVDCTGHGVPGALMSMIGNTLLNQIVIEKNITSPGEILNQLHIGVRHALKQDAGGDTRDGMDLSLIVLSHGTLEYAGANRNLWIIRDGQLLETKADKFPIAGIQQVRKDSFGETDHRFTKHEIVLEKNDCIYLTTDGYADQFGGPKGKKFMVKQLSNLLKAIQNEPMYEQRVILEHKFNEWKGSHEQVDDVLVIGIRIT